MQTRTSKALALLGGVATLALGSTFMLRLSPPAKNRQQLQSPCAPRMRELEQAECLPLPISPMAERLAELSVHAP
ncbi:MAG: hypothetical protein ABUL60_02990 [Myxococcales bacterium]